MSVLCQRRGIFIVERSWTIQAMLETAVNNRHDFHIIGFSDNTKSAEMIIRRVKPDIVTIDLGESYRDSAALLETIRDLTGVCKIVLLNNPAPDMLLVSKLVAIGASSCLSKHELGRDPNSFFNKLNAAAKAINKDKVKSSSNMGSRNYDYIKHVNHNNEARPLSFPIPNDESERIKIISEKNLSNATPERQFDLLTKYIANIAEFPACLLTFIDRDTQWIKSAYGLNIASTPRHMAFCNYTISQDGVFIVSNAHKDERFAHNPLVLNTPNIRTYAGSPVITQDGVSIGALCLIDRRARVVSKQVIDQLSAMSEIVAELIDQRLAVAA